MSTPLDDGTLANGDVIETIHISQLFPIVEALEDNQTNYRVDIGAVDAYKVDFSGSGQANEIGAYQAGQQILFKAANDNTGPSTLQVTGPSTDLSALPLTKNGGEELEPGDIREDQIVMAVYNDEGRFELFGLPSMMSDGSSFFRQDEGTADAYIIDASGSGNNPHRISAYREGQVVVFKAAQNNTGASTLQVVGPAGALSAKDLTKPGNVALVEGDIVAGQMVMAIYNAQGSGRFELVGSPSGGGGGEGSWLFGDGSDGNETISSHTDLMEHKFYDNLTVQSGWQLNTNGFKVHVRGTLTVDGVIHANGQPGENASGTTPGGGGMSGNYDLLAWQGHPGAAGSLQAGESVDSESQLVLYARGGYGGYGDFGSGGSGEGSGNEYIGERYFKTPPAYLSGVSDYFTNGGHLRVVAAAMGGGGGSGNDVDAAGGGGGGSGGILWIAARRLQGIGQLESVGGDGGEAGGTDAGGGGGGGGGIIYLLTNQATHPYSYNVDGGAGGAGGGGVGGNGGDGDMGLFVFRGGL